MKKIATFILTLVGVAAILVIMERSTEVAAQVQPLDDTVVKRGISFKATCGTMDGGAATDCLALTDGGQHFNGSDYLIENDSTTCVRVGVDAASVNNTHGTRIGSGCPGGQIYPGHASACFCESEGAKVIVDNTAAHP